MAFERKSVLLAGDTPGATTEFVWYRIGPADAPAKVHLQAALHADEQPGTMVLHHLLPLLRTADDAGLLRARFSVMPMVNPLGMAHFTLRRHIGRYDPRTGVNYNRRWPDLFPLVQPDLDGALTADAAENVTRIRAAVARWIDATQPRSAAEQARLLVLREAHDADIVLDLHCDDDSLIHIFTSPEFDLRDLADWMGAAATLTATDSGGGSFDEVLPQLYRKAAAAFASHPIPIATTAATLEYRGPAETFDELGVDDARRLYGFLCGRGLIDDDGGERPAPMPPALPFEATEIVRVDRPGLVAYRVGLGDRVAKGEIVAELIALDGPEAFIARTPIHAGTNGFVLSRAQQKYVPRGASVMKIVGTTPLAARAGGYLLED